MLIQMLLSVEVRSVGKSRVELVKPHSRRRRGDDGEGAAHERVDGSELMKRAALGDVGGQTCASELNLSMRYSFEKYKRTQEVGGGKSACANELNLSTS